MWHVIIYSVVLYYIISTCGIGVISVTVYSDRYDSFVPNVTDIFGSSEHSPAGAGRPPGVWTDVGPA